MKTLGDCYRQAGLAVLDGHAMLEDWTDVVLCHGYSTGTGGNVQGIRYGHAWVEGSCNGLDMALDATTGIVAFRAIYYMAGSIDGSKVRRYGCKETLGMVLLYEHWGPWDESPTTELDRLAQEYHGVNFREWAKGKS